MKLLSRNRTITIKKRLRQDGFVPIVTNDAKWDELAEAYINQNYRPKWIHANSRHSVQEIAYKLKKKSEEVLDEEYNAGNHRFYLMASQWCTVAQTIKARAEKMGFSFLNMDENNSVDNEIWEMRVLDYRPFDREVNMTDQLMNVGGLDKKIKAMKRMAKEMIYKKHYEENSELIWNTSIR